MGREKTLKGTLALALVFLVTVNCADPDRQQTNEGITDSSSGIFTFIFETVKNYIKGRGIDENSPITNDPSSGGINESQFGSDKSGENHLHSKRTKREVDPDVDEPNPHNDDDETDENEKVCSLDCGTNGNCKENGGVEECVCNTGYGGKKCEKVKCTKEDDCTGKNNKCNKDNFCQCENGYEGDDCSVLTICKDLVDECNNIGTKCVVDKDDSEKGTCECTGGLKYDGKQKKCAVKCTKEEECTGKNNKCNKDNFCQCENGYEGDDCSVLTLCKDMVDECINIGTTCVVDQDDFEKVTCECTGDLKYDGKQKKCAVKCTKEEDCTGKKNKCNKDNFCQCENGYEGDDCSVLTVCKDLVDECNNIGTKCVVDEDDSEKGTCECTGDLKYDGKQKKCAGEYVF